MLQRPSVINLNITQAEVFLAEARAGTFVNARLKWEDSCLRVYSSFQVDEDGSFSMKSAQDHLFQSRHYYPVLPSRDLRPAICLFRISNTHCA